MTVEIPRSKLEQVSEEALRELFLFTKRSPIHMRGDVRARKWGQEIAVRSRYTPEQIPFIARLMSDVNDLASGEAIYGEEQGASFGQLFEEDLIELMSKAENPNAVGEALVLSMQKVFARYRELVPKMSPVVDVFESDIGFEVALDLAGSVFNGIVNGNQGDRPRLSFANIHPASSTESYQVRCFGPEITRTLISQVELVAMRVKDVPQVADYRDKWEMVCEVDL